MGRGSKPNLPVTTDVIVVGGGPAGAAAAIKCAEAGLRVVLLERESLGRDRPGETLHPGVEPLLAQLGVRDEVVSAGFLRHEGHWVNWTGQLRFEPFGGDELEPWRGFQVWRADFDAILLRRAESLGVTLKRSCRVLKPLIEDRRVVGVATSEGTIMAPGVIDASGGRQWLARRLHLPIVKASPRLIVRYGYAARTSTGLGQEPALIADTHGWTWTALVKPDLLAWNRLNFDDSEPEAGSVLRALQGLEPKGKTRAADVTWRMVKAAAGPGYFLVGDAASVLDPASSHGVLKALMTGLMAGHLIVNRAKREVGESESTDAYNAWIRNWFVHDSEKLRALYRVFPTCLEWPPAIVRSAS